ncbi:MAG: UDP-N-acetylmuramoyl-L-alanyl-D-glutamate--2,6-diaminopimelate ligase [Alphaproteobacteria bacterium]
MNLPLYTIEQLVLHHKGISADSRRIKKGDLFVALPPSFQAGRNGGDYILSAIKNGATGILTNDKKSVTTLLAQENCDAGVSIIASDQPRRDLSLLLAAQAGDMPDHLALVTGTNGKSSIVQMARELWQKTGIASASIGTLGVVKGASVEKKYDDNPIHTTPDPEWLYPALAKLKQAGINHVAIEASSHGLHQYRLDGVSKKTTAAAMAELSQDHLDYHLTIDDYYASKLRLFSEILPRNGRAIFWQDMAVADNIANICDKRGLIKTMMCHAKHNNPADKNIAGAILSLMAVSPTADAAQKVDFIFMEKHYSITIPLAGYFQVENALTALLLVMADNSESELQKFLPQLAYLSPIRGRLEKIADNQGAIFFVDYAHTAVALKTALMTLRPFTKKNLLVVFGCGGDRDSLKRPKMGQVANHYADKIIITDDNPRGESPVAIRRSIMASCPKGIEAEHRQAAIAMAVKMASAGDVVLVAGKGHETGQMVGDKILPFDDAVVIRQEIKQAGV